MIVPRFPSLHCAGNSSVKTTKNELKDPLYVLLQQLELQNT